MHGRIGSLAALAALLAIGAAPAQAAEPPGPDGRGTDYFVTFAARQCPTYDSITANKARNNIQESLQDLGPDTPYSSDDPVDADTEAAAQPACSPIVGWRFKLGTGIAGSPVIGPWGSLSVVSNPFDTAITTIGSVPRRDDRGRPIAQTIQGATTIELTRDQANRAAGSSQLWTQGGTTSDPVLNGEFPNQYGFGALRCAVDNVNGDNVEYIQFPSGTRHVYCFAYYVTPPPTSGRIVIKKKVADPPNADQEFTFKGNISYTEDQRFTLDVSNGSTPSETFYRGATGADDDPWTVRELLDVVPGWSLTGLDCTASGSAVTTNVATASVSIRLAARDTVTCTFTDSLKPPPGNLLLSKITRGGLGTFSMFVRPQGGGDTIRTSATTVDEGVPAPAEAGRIDLDPGTYAVAERLPRPTRRGHWRRTAVNCGAQRRVVRRLRPMKVTISAGKGAVCTFENRFIPRGSITIAKSTLGRTGTTGFVVAPLRRPVRQYMTSATTKAERRPALARGDSTRHLRLGTYVIQETGTTPEGQGNWTLMAVICGHRLHRFTQGRAIVRLTAGHPHVGCLFVNSFKADVPPPPTPRPQPPPGPGPSPAPDLVVTKTALQKSVEFGAIARFRIVVRNVGNAAAEQVVIADGSGSNGEIVSAKPSQGSCSQKSPLICRIGLLNPGQRATILVRVRATDLGQVVNTVVAATSSAETRLDNNADRARVTVRPTGQILGVCAGARAHAAC